MANLLEISQLVFNQIQPNPNDETAIQIEEVISSAKLQYSWEMWRLSKEEKREEGYFNIPSSLLTQVELEVEEGIANISELNILRSLTDDTWLINIGGLLSPCKYVATNVNLLQLLGDDDSMGEDYRPYLVIGNQIQFPRGTHETPIKIIYANNGVGLNEEEVNVDDMIGAIIRTKLIDLYLRRGQEDLTNNSDSTK